MSANEEDGLISLMNLQKRERYFQKVVKQLRLQIDRCLENMGSGEFGEAFVESMRNDQRQYWRMMRAIMKRKEEYVREFINKEVIYVSKGEHLEALIFLKREGWTGKALIHQEEFGSELSKNNIPFIRQVS